MTDTRETPTSAVDQREAAPGVDVDRTVNGVDDSRAHLSRGDRPGPGDDSADLVAGSGSRGRAECDEGGEEATQGDGPNDQTRQGLCIPFGSARQPKTS